MTKTGAAARPDFEDRAEDFKEWALMHTRLLTGVAVAIVVVAGGTWVYRKSQAAQAQNAQTSLMEAEQALGAGNSALAQSDLEKLIGRYGSTDAGHQAHLVLAQAYYDAGKYSEGVTDLEKFASSAPAELAASTYNLIGAGYEQESKFDEAAAAYQKAAGAAAGKSDRDSYMASAARALTAGGKTADAIKIWTKLADDPSSASSAEARVRLGELEAKPVKAG